jgi:hypothetical protein
MVPPPVGLVANEPNAVDFLTAEVQGQRHIRTSTGKEVRADSTFAAAAESSPQQKGEAMKRAFVRRFTLRRGRWFLPGVVVGAALAGGAVTFAAIPDSGGAIHGCYQKNVGNLRVIDPSAGDSCRP